MAALLDNIRLSLLYVQTTNYDRSVNHSTSGKKLITLTVTGLIRPSVLNVGSLLPTPATRSNN